MSHLIQTLSLWQPWASLWTYGKKKIETRSWKLYGNLPRTLAVHAAKRFQEDERAVCLDEPFRVALSDIGYAKIGDIPLGCVLGLVDIVRVYRFDGTMPPEPECKFGNYEPGRWGFVAENFRPFATPIPAKGCQGPFGWEMPDDVVFADGKSPPDITHGATALSAETKRERKQMDVTEMPNLFESGKGLTT